MGRDQSPGVHLGDYFPNLYEKKNQQKKINGGKRPYWPLLRITLAVDMLVKWLQIFFSQWLKKSLQSV